MDELNINNLPPEMLTEVFRYLNEGNLRNATMACKLWNNLIESAFRWSLKLEHEKTGEPRSNIPDDEEQTMNFILTTNRKFGTIEIHWGRLNENQRILRIFKRHGFNVVELRLYDCRMNLTGIAELLTFTPNLKHAFVQMGISHNSSDVLLTDQLLPDLKKLKTLDICGSDYGTIKCFRKVKLATIRIWECMSSENRSLLVDFLLTQDELTSLTVEGSSILILVEMGKQNVLIPFRLTQLSISGTFNWQKSSQQYDHLMKFIQSQARNVTEIGMNYEISSSEYECVFANMVNMTKLTTLSVKINDLPRDYDLYERLNENRNVHTVTLVNNAVSHIQVVHKFLQKFPNIRSLTLWNTKRSFNKDFRLFSKSLGKLESLYIDTIHGTSLDGVKFPNLKTLNIEHLGGKINWNGFTKAHPLLIDLIIEIIHNESYLTSDDIDQITTNVDLQHIGLGAGFLADNRFFEIVASKCRNLKVLDLHKSCISQSLGHYMKIDVLRLRDSIKRPKVFRSHQRNSYRK